MHGQQNIKFNFLDRFSKNTEIENLMKICPVGAELFRAEGQRETGGQTDITQLIVDFRKFCETCLKTTQNNCRYVLRNRPLQCCEHFIHTSSLIWDHPKPTNTFTLWAEFTIFIIFTAGGTNNGLGSVNFDPAANAESGNISSI